MSQSLKVAKLRRIQGVIEDVPSEIPAPEMAKKKEAIVGMNGAIKPATTEVKANNMAWFCHTRRHPKYSSPYLPSKRLSLDMKYHTSEFQMYKEEQQAADE